MQIDLKAGDLFFLTEDGYDSIVVWTVGKMTSNDFTSKPRIDPGEVVFLIKDPSWTLYEVKGFEVQGEVEFQFILDEKIFEITVLYKLDKPEDYFQKATRTNYYQYKQKEPAKRKVQWKL